MIKSIDDLASTENQLIDVEIKVLKTHADDRGFFREIIRASDSVFSVDSSLSQPTFAQWSHSKMAVNTVKAWHYHHQQYDWWYIGLGTAHIALFDLREESSTFNKKIEFKLGDPKEDPEALEAVVRIPPGVAHACKALSPVAHLFYITSEIYNPNDEGRYRFNSPRILHDWGKEADLIVAPNDKRDFVPTAERKIKASR